MFEDGDVTKTSFRRPIIDRRLLALDEADMVEAGGGTTAFEDPTNEKIDFEAGLN